MNDIQQTEDDESQEDAQSQIQDVIQRQSQSYTQDSEQAQELLTPLHSELVENQTASVALQAEDSPAKYSTRPLDEVSSDFDPDETLWDQPESITGMVYSTLP